MTAYLGTTYTTILATNYNSADVAGGNGTALAIPSYYATASAADIARGRPGNIDRTTTLASAAAYEGLHQLYAFDIEDAGTAQGFCVQRLYSPAHRIRAYADRNFAILGELDPQLYMGQYGRQNQAWVATLAGGSATELARWQRSCRFAAQCIDHGHTAATIPPLCFTDLYLFEFLTAYTETQIVDSITLQVDELVRNRTFSSVQRACVLLYPLYHPASTNPNTPVQAALWEYLCSTLADLTNTHAYPLDVDLWGFYGMDWINDVMGNPTLAARIATFNSYFTP